MWRLVMMCLLASGSCELDKVCKVQGRIVRRNKMVKEMKCEDVGEKLKSAERLVLLAPKTRAIKITPQCLPKMRTIEVRGTDLFTCEEFQGFPLVMINKRICGVTVSL